MMINLIYVLLGIIAGGVITWFVSRRYYIKANKDLNIRTEALINRIELILRTLEHGKIVEFTHDDHGNIKNILIKLRASAHTKSSTSSPELEL